MRLGIGQLLDRLRRMNARTLIVVVGFMFLVPLHTPAAQVQQRNNSSTNPSDLALQNLSRVAASAAEIKAVLLKDAGLMVELKRWVAKDATDHGQIIGEGDLSDYAIFDRLGSDVEFRSTATALVQKYGYLLPKLNPESDLAKEQDLLRIERTKWMAQAQEEERAQARQKAAQELQKAAACDPQSGNPCNNPPLPQAPTERQIGTVPAQAAPRDMDLPNFPVGPGDMLQRTQLMQTGGSSTGGLSQNSQLSLISSAGGGNPFSSSSSAAGGPSSDTEGTGRNSQLASAYGGGASAIGGSSDGLLGAFGMGSGAAMGMGTGTGSGLLGGAGPMDNMSPSGSAASLLVPMQPNRKYPERASTESPEMVRKLSPYMDVPSLFDMYMQTVSRPSTPKRFGAEVFENGTHDLQLIPMDLPAGPDYVVGPGDGLTIDLWGGISTRLIRTVDRGGQISLPEMGPVLVSGKTLAAIQQDLQQALRNQYRDVSTGVSLSRLRTIRIYEVGDVVNAGTYDISSLSTPLNALFVAGGPSTRGSLRILNHYRGSQLVQTVDVYDLLLHGVKTNIERLENGDTVQVPPIGPQVTLEGMVRRPAIYELRDEKNLASVLELAGGLLPAASLRHIEVQRLVAHEKQTMLSVDIPESADTSEVTKRLEAFEIHDGDRIRIYPIAPYNQDTIYVEGHVVRPGRYSYRPDMRVTDVISSYKDMLPEPATQYAEIIRLNAPDFRPSVESFSLTDALADPSKAPVLHPMDTLRIFSRFDFENPPAVSVLGDVREPGVYRTAGQVHLADAIHLAGGLTPDAQTSDAQVFRYLPDGKFKIFSVSLSQALIGDPVENILLEPRDRLLIHRNPDSIEQASVYIQGEVGKPGRYPLTTNMRVADLIHIGGGLKPSADSDLADLTTYEWTDQKKLAGQRQELTISDALAGDSKANQPLHNGDVLTIRQLPGWNDLGASITLKGEVKKPGVYGIRPGEHLSSILERAGGFQADGYAYGAILQRIQVRDLEMKEQESLILRVKSAQSSIELMPENDPRQKQAKETAMQQYETTLEQLSANPPIGRVSVRLSSEISRWKNTSADMEVRAGDTLIIPKKPSYVLVTGQVFNPTAIAYRPGKSAAWYLSQAGGPTLMGNKKSVFVIRADGSVLGSKKGLWSGESLGAPLQPGDTVVVPERAIGGPVNWQVIFSAAQVASSVASTVFIALHY
jgi:protein involved in polysaccharide export with SLBB domain